ncbi:uncharacterized protein LOC106878996 [Octopus bimaculoides]|uniref:uncharacterized protein LOC106878996 n=1 Tax=Octopus bimaculoides TaxID=37653 RepID=UPI00071E4BA1|nr:uncharacterized protein LOC106878996 [Octopus bimaculoides]|eukprot:XP_014783863.1 PREDICTED: uncharacterized protein LOC106878996 [Octopus bimaculoides]
MFSDDTKPQLLEYIRDSLDRNVFTGPYGQRQVLYLDYVASGRALSFIEEYVRNEVLPDYGNTHTTTSITSLQTTLYRHEARDIIRNAANASEHDAVIFVGSGTTAAVHKLIFSLDLKEPPVIFAGPFEHHSNLLPWREIGSEVIQIKTNSHGSVDIGDLERNLQEFSTKNCQMIGSFSAASNITGVLTNADAVSACLHRYGALAFWDYATAAPYLTIDMNPVVPGPDQRYVYKDAVYFSPHKFVGGISTPGILIAKKYLFKNSTPEGCGGGTIFFVRRENHRFLHEPEMREEGGTPDIVGSIRAGLVMQLKLAIGTDVVAQRDQQLLKKATDCWKKCKNLVILGTQSVPSLPIYSFLIYHPQTGRFLHHNYVTALLNDVFGIQSRGGCACAGPYAEDLLGISEEKAKEFENVLTEDSRLDRVHLKRYREYSPMEILRPGFTRLNLPFFVDNETLDFVIQAVELVAEFGWHLLPQYRFNPETGEWRHKDLQSGAMKYRSQKNGYGNSSVPDYQECLREAKDLFKTAEKMKISLPDQSLLFENGTQHLRWFLLPCEAYTCISEGTFTNFISLDALPFVPKSFANANRQEESSDLTVVAGNNRKDGVGEEGDGGRGDGKPGDQEVEEEIEVKQECEEEESGTNKIAASVPQVAAQNAIHESSLCDTGMSHSEEFCKSIKNFLERGFSFGHCDDLSVSFDKTLVLSESGHGSDNLDVNPTCTPVGTTLDAAFNPLNPYLYPNPVTNSHLSDATNVSPNLKLYHDPGLSLNPNPNPDPNLNTSHNPNLNLNPNPNFNPSVNPIHNPNHNSNPSFNNSNLNRNHTPSYNFNPNRQISSFENYKLKSSSKFQRSTTTTTAAMTAEGRGKEEEEEKGVANVNSSFPSNRDEREESCNETPEGVMDKTGVGVNSVGLAVTQRSGCCHCSNNNNAGHGATQCSCHGNDNDTNKECRDCCCRSLSETTTLTKPSMTPLSEKGPDVTATGAAGSKAEPQMTQCCLRKAKLKTDQRKVTKKGNLWVSPPKELFTPVIEAIADYNMIQDGDRILLCLSGGKDSLSMLHILHQYQFYAKSKGTRFDIGAVTVDPQTPSYNPSPLKKYLSCLGVPYFFESQGIMDTASNLPYKCESICSFCSRMKRGRIYMCARREGYNVVSLGQHLDDLAESFLMSFFHNGIMRTMKAHYTVQDNDLRVIRPLVYVREKNLRRFAEKNQLPVISENCPACFEAPKERHRMKQLLAAQELLFPKIYNSMRSAMTPIMAINKTGFSSKELFGVMHRQENGDEEEDDD